jgi:hypothetical protein
MVGQWDGLLLGLHGFTTLFDDSQGLILFGGVGSANKATSALWDVSKEHVKKWKRTNIHTYIYIFIMYI